METMANIHVNLEEDSYDILIEPGLISRVGPLIKQLTGADRVAIITEDCIGKQHTTKLLKTIKDSNLLVRVITVPSGEACKTFHVLGQVYEAIAGFGLDRGDAIIAYGGGAVGDMAGFTASTYKGGIQYVQIPTSLTAQLGSCIGGNVGIDMPSSKNLVSTIYQPKGIFIDPEVLSTLTNDNLHTGLVEAVKIACVQDKDLFFIFEKAKNDVDLRKKLPEIIERCCRIKARFSEKDEYAEGARMILEFGNTIAHAIEGYNRYDDTYTHGEALAVGMYLITRQAEKLGLTQKGCAERIRYVLEFLHVPHTTDIPAEDLMLYMKNDKKIWGDMIRLVLLKTIGQGYLHPVRLKNLPKYIVTGVE
jgi:3-dehydroquinate synthase